MQNIKKLSLNIEMVVLFLIFITSMNMFGKYFYLLFAAFILLAIAIRKIKIDWITILLIVLSLFYMIFSIGMGNSLSVVFKQLAYPIAYLIGLNLFSFDERSDNGCDNRDLCHRKIFSVIFCMAAGSLLHYILNMVTNLGSLNRNTIDIWSGSVMAATGQATLAMLAVCYFITILFRNVHWKWKILSIFGCLIIFTYNLILSVRLLILIYAIVFIEAFIFSLRGKTVKGLKKRYLITLFAIIIIVMAFQFNWFGLADAINATNLFKRIESMGFFNDTRLNFKIQYILLMFKHPFGGEKIHDVVGNYAHDIILDTYSDVGFIGAVLLIVFLVVSVVQMVKFIINNKFSIDSRMLVLCTGTVFLIVFFFEPILSGMAWFFCSFCLFQGALTSMNRSVRLWG